MATTAAALSLKLFVDTKAQRVEFAEAGKDAVDFLSSLGDWKDAVPIATAVELLGKDALPGCIGNFCASVQKLNVLPGAANDEFPLPTVPSPNVYGKGFVQETYSVSDDLTVTPFHPRAMMLSHLQEKTVLLGHNEVLLILKALLRSSKTVLTDVFLGEN